MWLKLHLQGNFIAFIKEQHELKVQLSKLGKEPENKRRQKETKSKK